MQGQLHRVLYPVETPERYADYEAFLFPGDAALYVVNEVSSPDCMDAALIPALQHGADKERLWRL